MATLCACGCGTEVSPGKTYRKAHQFRKPKLPVEPVPCLCGCGEFTTIYRGKPKRFVAGHQAKGANNSRFGAKASEETRAKISSANQKAYQEGRLAKTTPGWKHSSESRQRMSESHAKNLRVGPKNPFFGRRHSEETKAQIAATKARMFVLPTAPERMVHEELHRLGVPFLTEHPIGVYKVDVFLPSYNLVLFVDGCYWHACPTHHPTRKRPGSDNSRGPYFRAGGYNIEFLWEHEILEDVCQAVRNTLKNYPAVDTRML